MLLGMRSRVGSVAAVANVIVWATGNNMVWGTGNNLVWGYN